MSSQLLERQQDLFICTSWYPLEFMNEATNSHSLSMIVLWLAFTNPFLYSAGALDCGHVCL